MALVLRFAKDEGGATAIEYGLITALMAVGCIAAFIAFGGNLQGLYGMIDSRAGGAMNSAG